MSTSAVAATPAATTSQPERRPNIRLIFLGLALGTLWFVCCRHMSAEWSYNEQYSYGWFVPFFALYLFWLRWDDKPAVGSRRSEIGDPNRRGELACHAEAQRRRVSPTQFAVAATLLLLFLILPIRLIEVANPDWRAFSWAHAFVAVGLTLLLVGWRGGKSWVRHFAFPILFFLVAVPWPSDIEQPIIQGLMPTVANIATGVLSLFGIPAEVQGNLIHINGGVVGVNEACSGVRSLQTSLMIGLLFGELNRLSLARRLGLIAAAVLIAFVANCGRAFFLVWIAANRGVSQVERWHDIAGYAIVGLVFVGCLGLTKLLSRGRKPPAPPTNSSSFVIRHSSFVIPSWLALAALAWLVTVEVGVDAWYRAHERNLQQAVRWNVRWPESAPQFRDVKIDERTRSLLHQDEGRGAVWTTAEPSLTDGLRSSATALLYFFRWYPGHNSALLANAHRPDVCLPASGWRQKNDFGVQEYAATPTLTIPFRHFEFENDASGRQRFAHAFYCVWEDRVRKGETAEAGMASTPSAWTRSERIQAVLQGRRHLGQQVMEYLLIETRETPQDEAEKAFAAQVPELVVPASKS